MIICRHHESDTHLIDTPFNTLATAKIERVTILAPPGSKRED